MYYWPGCPGPGRLSFEYYSEVRPRCLRRPPPFIDLARLLFPLLREALDG